MGFLQDNELNRQRGLPYVVVQNGVAQVINQQTGQTLTADQYNAALAANPGLATGDTKAWNTIVNPAPPPPPSPAPPPPAPVPPAPVTPPPAPGTPGVPLSATSQTALDQINGVLGTYGLSSLANWAWQEVVNGSTADQIVEDLRQTPQYEARFPGLNQMRQSGQGLTEAQWVSYEQQARGLFKQAGLPAGFGDQPADIAKYITNNTSVNELQQRVTWAQDSAAQNWNIEGARLYGMTPGDFTAMELDPTAATPLVEQRYRAAQAAGVSTQTGFGQLSASDAELAAQAKPSQAEEYTKFGKLGLESQLFQSLNAGEAPISQTEGIQAEFQQNAQAQQEIEARRQGRLAVFQGGGSFAAGSGQGKGFTGAG